MTLSQHFHELPKQFLIIFLHYNETITGSLQVGIELLLLL